jgi:hypothetical protein
MTAQNACIAQNGPTDILKLRIQRVKKRTIAENYNKEGKYESNENT